MSGVLAAGLAAVDASTVPRLRIVRHSALRASAAESLSQCLHGTSDIRGIHAAQYSNIRAVIARRDKEQRAASVCIRRTKVIAAIREKSETVLLAFSCGKDSIAAWLECRKHFKRIVPFYMYLVPELEFVNRSLAYYEKFFGERIVRMPHPSLYRMLNRGVFQAPENRDTIVSAQLPEFDYADVYKILRDENNLPAAYCATGVRAVDSPYRMISLKMYGAINHNKMQFYPVWDWNKARLIGEIRSAGVKLPVDYRAFGRSFDGLDYRFLGPMKRYFPRDYARVLEYFPMAEAELKRREYAQTA
jgi:hypothetical protein